MYARTEFDVLAFCRRGILAYLLGTMYVGGFRGSDGQIFLATGVALVGLCAILPPIGSVRLDEHAVRLRRGWRRLSIPRDAIRSVQPVDVCFRLVGRAILGRGGPKNEWRLTQAAQRGVELVFRSDLPHRLKVRLPDEHLFRVILGDPAGLLRALESGGEG